jgi:hypothetical protein
MWLAIRLIVKYPAKKSASKAVKSEMLPHVATSLGSKHDKYSLRVRLRLSVSLGHGWTLFVQLEEKAQYLNDIYGLSISSCKCGTLLLMFNAVSVGL